MNLSRRSSLKHLALAAAGLPLATAAAQTAERVVQNGRIQQSVVPWCFKPMPDEELASHAARLGLRSVELCRPALWPRLKELGLQCAIASSHGFAKGFAQPAQHAECIATLEKVIETCAAAGVQRVITFSGFRQGLSDEVGIRNMVEGLKKIIGFAEKHKVTLCLEHLNSRVATEMKGHPDYFCDDLERCIEICRQVGSERMKVLFDIYHLQIMHGDVTTRLRQHFPYIGHVHTAGVPGRNEIDTTQELNYPALMRTLVELKYDGYVGQEFIPLRDPVASLADAARLCDV